MGGGRYRPKLNRTQGKGGGHKRLVRSSSRIRWPQVIAVNEGGARRVSEPTFFYLPHCEGVLCDALLGANWSPPVGDSNGGSNGGGGGGGLPSVVILGNSFRTYQDRCA